MGIPRPVRGGGPRRWWYAWRLYGLPRCAGWMTPISECNRLLWPWFDMGGNGEDAMCRACTIKLDAWHFRDDRDIN